MDFDPTITISIIIAIIALISPIVTAIINNCHQTKIKKMDMYETAKREALTDFIHSAQATIFNSENPEFMLSYIASFNKLFIYFTDISSETLNSFDRARADVANNLTEETFQKANYELSKIISNLSKQIKKYKK